MKVPNRKVRALPEPARSRGGLSRAGFTVVELMVAIGVLLVAVLSTFSTQVTSLNLMRTSRETNSAVADLSTAMEAVMLDAADLIPTKYPAGTPIAAFNERSLDAERIVPTYPGIALGSSPDTLPILLTLTWNDFQGRPRSLTLRSMKTR